MWRYGAGTGWTPQPFNEGLETSGALQVWDFDFGSAQVLAATYDGVYMRSIGGARWQRLGDALAGQSVRSIALVGSTVYAGLLPGGIYTLDLNGAQVWKRTDNGIPFVRDLVYDQDHCQGLLAATGDGVWVYR
ncbi:MAG: hypothetical protein IPK16_28575 [Anaerolineales bacterium]|nr:hypothetical protein [Anaerolineales bacterium]